MEIKNKILIVEDELVNRMILTNLLQPEYDVLQAENGQAALDILTVSRNEISAVLLDVIMPVMDGYEFLKQIHNREIIDLPIIVTTGMSDVEAEKRALENGAWDFVTKPYNAKILLSRLRNAIARSEVEVYKQMQEIIAHDPLTGLYNRGMMFEQTKRMMDENPDKVFAFLRFDVDHFALYNMSFGEAEGNRLLMFMADCLREASADAALCKYCHMSADVFCICYAYNGTEDGLYRYVESLQKKLDDYRKDYLLSLSVGACIAHEPGLSVDDMYFRATIAAKKCKNQYEDHLAFYDDASGKKMEGEIVIQNEMQTALDEEQFVVYLQPKFTIETDKICGAEALVRWVHPTKGMISPGVFILVFEKNGFISKLDYYVWDKTCAIIRKWLDQGKKVYPVSVNVSRISLYNPSLTQVMKGLLKKYNLDASYFQLEITESAYMSDPELMEKIILSLHEAGFTILMDDFGSGYSSLNTLKRIYIDVLKVDMKFLPVEEKSGRAEIILTCVIKMAKLLGLTVITEGVETRIQRDFLEGVGCDVIQGYYYSRPISIEEYEEKYVKPSVAFTPVEHRERTKAVNTKKAQILIVDDSEMDQEILKQNLSDKYDIQTCNDAESALAYLKKNVNIVKLILLDNKMTGMSGLEFLNHCRLDSALNAIPKIMITADDDAVNQVEAFKKGAYDYIAKPLRREILLARVNHVMEFNSRFLLYESINNDEMYFAEHDVPTGLINKSAFIEITNRMLQLDAENSALFVIDIDNFKRVNDRYGHLMGDKVIQCTADGLKKIFRKTDVVGRFGGDEFVVLMTSFTNRDSVRKKSEEILKSVKFSIINQLGVNASLSIGVAFGNMGDMHETLFDRADRALYEAKNTGKNKSVIYGEEVPEVIDDDRPIVLVCSEDPQVYPAIALSYGEEAGFINIRSYKELSTMFKRYHDRIRTVCLDMQKQSMDDSTMFYDFIIKHGGGTSIPILVFCNDGNIDQIREAVKLNITDILSLPPHISTIRNKLSTAIMQAETAIRDKEM